MMVKCVNVGFLLCRLYVLQGCLWTCYLFLIWLRVLWVGCLIWVAFCDFGVVV